MNNIENFNLEFEHLKKDAKLLLCFICARGEGAIMERGNFGQWEAIIGQ